MLELTNGETYQIEPGRTLNPSTGQSKVISLFFIKPTAKVQASSESRGFYDEIVNGKGIFSTKYQLYTFAIMVALLRNATPVPISKTGIAFIFMAGNNVHLRRFNIM